MSRIDAFRFISRCRMDAGFRSEAYEAGDAPEVRAWAASAGYAFTPAEAEDAFNSLLLRAVDDDEASEITELRRWYSLVAGTDDGPCGGGNQRSATCAACAIKTSCGAGNGRAGALE